MKRQIIFVSAGLGLGGGGTAVVGRLLLRVVGDMADEVGAGVLTLSLGEPAPFLRGNVRAFYGSQARLAAALFVAEASPATAAVVFDFMGPARVQSLMPGPLRKPYLVYLHGVEVWRNLSWQRRSALERAAVLLCNSDYTRKRAREWSPWLPEITPVGLALEERAPEGDCDGKVLEEAGSEFVLIVGRMASTERYKGHDALLRAMHAVVRARPSARLVVVGDGDDRARIEAEGRRSGLAGSVIFPGFVSEATLAMLYAKCSLFAMPSKNEGFGLVYLEAMRASKPCLGVTGSAAGEIIQDGSTGVLVPYDNHSALGDSMLDLLQDKEKAARLGRAGCQRWHEHFRFEQFRSRCIHHLRSLVAGGSGS